MNKLDDNNSKYLSHAENVTNGEDVNINVLEWVLRFLKYWYLFVIGVLIAFAFGYVKNRSWVPLYKTEGKIIIESNSRSSYNLMQGFGSPIDYVNTNNQLLILGSYDLINRTVQKLPFDVDYYTRGRFRTNYLYGREPIKINLEFADPQVYGLEFRFVSIDSENFQILLANEKDREVYPNYQINGKYGVPFENFLMFATIDKLYIPAGNFEFLFRFRSLASLENEFASRLHLSNIGESSSVVSISLVGNVVKRDKDFIDALSAEYLESNLEAKNEEAIRTIAFINEQLALLFDSLQQSESLLRQYRRENNIVDVDAYTSSILSKMSMLDNKRSELMLKSVYFENLSKYLNESLSEERLVAPSTIGISDPVLLDLVSKYNELQQKRSDIGEQNPNYERYSKKMDEVRATMLEVLNNVRNVHAVEREAFERECNDVMADLHDLPEKELMMLTYERSYKINDNYYTYLLQKKSEAQIRKASNVSDNKILQKARINYAPVNGGEKTKNYLFFVVIGLLLPAVFVVLKELLNVRLRNESDVAKITQVPILVTILRTTDDSKIASVKNLKSLFAEGFRLLRSRIEFIVQRKSDISIMITSAESGDGKTFLAANLAGIYSLLSDKVVLVDLDMRNPKMSSYLGCDNRKGLVHVLIGEATLDDVIVKDSDEFGFHFIPVGIVPPNSAELLRSEKMMQILEELSRRYAYRIYDTSPLGLVSDAYALTNSVDVNLLIARAFKTNKFFFRNFMEQVQQDRVNNPYIVLNDLAVSTKKKYGKYGYYGRYTYGRYYYGDAKYYHQQSAKYYTEN